MPQLNLIVKQSPNLHFCLLNLCMCLCLWQNNFETHRRKTKWNNIKMSERGVRLPWSSTTASVTLNIDSLHLRALPWMMEHIYSKGYFSFNVFMIMMESAVYHCALKSSIDVQLGRSVATVKATKYNTHHYDVNKVIPAAQCGTICICHVSSLIYLASFLNYLPFNMYGILYKCT